LASREAKIDSSTWCYTSRILVLNVSTILPLQKCKFNLASDYKQQKHRQGRQGAKNHEEHQVKPDSLKRSDFSEAICFSYSIPIFKDVIETKSTCS